MMIQNKYKYNREISENHIGFCESVPLTSLPAQYAIDQILLNLWLNAIRRCKTTQFLEVKQEIVLPKV